VSPLKGVTPHLFYLTDLVWPLFFVNSPTIFFRSGITPLQGVTRGGPPPVTLYSDTTGEREEKGGTKWAPKPFFSRAGSKYGVTPALEWLKAKLRLAHFSVESKTTQAVRHWRTKVWGRRIMGQQSCRGGIFTSVCRRDIDYVLVGSRCERFSDGSLENRAYSALVDPRRLAVI